MGSVGRGLAERSSEWTEKGAGEGSVDILDDGRIEMRICN